MKVIAEIGSNWSTFEDCKNSIAQAKLSGADAVKFQLYSAEALYGFKREISNELPVEWLPKLYEKANACGIEFMCTAFSPELINVVDPYVKTHKVASAELTHVRMLEKLKQIGKPVYLSTGASGEADITMALEVIGNTPVTLMHCIAAYPARATKLKRITELKKFNRPVGYSDHSISCDDIPVLAKSFGATVIEKHVNFVSANGPDSPHSLTGAEFKYMCAVLKSQVADINEERAMVMQHNRRIVALKEIREGETLIENENFGIFRALKEDALSPFLINEVNGKIAKRDISAGNGIGPSDI